MDAEVETGQRSTVIAIKRANPALTQWEIADQVGVSRERVRQILKSAGMVTKRVHRWCEHCGAPITNRYKRRFCCQGCRTAASTAANSTVEVICDYCGETFERRGKLMSILVEKRGYKHSFCSRECFYKYVGEYVFPGPRPQTRVYDRSRLLEMRRVGYTLKQISEATGAGVSYVCKVIKDEERRTGDGRTSERVQTV